MVQISNSCATIAGVSYNSFNKPGGRSGSIFALSPSSNTGGRGGSGGDDDDDSMIAMRSSKAIRRAEAEVITFSQR